MMKRMIFNAALIIAMASVISAQVRQDNKQSAQSCTSQSSALKSEPDDKRQTLVFSGGLPAIEGIQPVNLSSERDAWAVQIITRGGFLNQVESTLLTSQGELTLSPTGTTRNAPKISAGLLNQVKNLIASLNFPLKVMPLSGLCNDCYKHTLVLHRRESNGVVRIYTVTWDDTTAKDLPADLSQIYAAVMGLGETKK